MSGELLLWLDFETTGLSPLEEDTVLEAGWMITNGDLDQLTPLRQRYTRLDPYLDAPRSRDEPRTPLPGSDDWENGLGVSPAVREMHQRSGLEASWKEAHEQFFGESLNLEKSSVEGLRFIDSGVALQEAILGDVASAVTRYGPALIHLAGAGVSHFDQEALAYHCPRLGRMLHYRAFDTSVATQVLGVPKIPAEDLIERAPKIHINMAGAEKPLPLTPESAPEHRATGDVLRSYVTALLLRQLDRKEA
jgi:hypothetical protein